MNETHFPARESASDVDYLARVICGFRASGLVCATAQLGLADLVGPEGAFPDDLARQVDCKPEMIFRLLRALAAIGIFEENSTGAFVHTQLSGLLRKSAEPSLHGLACLIGMTDLFAWPHILHSLRTGEAAFPKVFGTGIFEYMKTRPELREVFDRAMGGFTEVVGDALVKAYDFSAYRTIVDIGGGNGSLLKKILERNPQAHGMIFDLPEVVERTRRELAGTTWDGKLSATPGNFFEFVPEGADLYVIKIVLCDWADDDVKKILRNIRKVTSSGRLLIADAILLAGKSGSFPKHSDVNMMVITGGRERTEEEFRSLLNSTGFRVNRVQFVHEWVGLIEAVPEN